MPVRRIHQWLIIVVRFQFKWRFLVCGSFYSSFRKHVSSSVIGNLIVSVWISDFPQNIPSRSVWVILFIFIRGSSKIPAVYFTLSQIVSETGHAHRITNFPLFCIWTVWPERGSLLDRFWIGVFGNMFSITTIRLCGVIHLKARSFPFGLPISRKSFGHFPHLKLKLWHGFNFTHNEMGNNRLGPLVTARFYLY